MGCRKKGHIHDWPTKGTLTVQRCEVRCNYCTGDAGYKDWKYAWFLRRHVRAMHTKKGKYKGLRVDAGWDEESPRDRPQTRRSSAFIKPEPTSDDDVGGIPQTVGDLEEGPIPDFVTQPNFDNFDDATYQALTNRTSNRNGFGMPGATYGNPNATLPILAGEDPFGMEDHSGISEEFQEWINTTTGFDGNPEEPEEIEDAPLIDIDQLMTEDRGEPVGEPVIPTTSSGRFFMSDASAPESEFDEADDMPLADRMDNYNYAANAPNDQTHHNILQMLHGVADTLEQNGMDALQMLPTMQLFMRTLHQERHETYPC